jgi:hypothetical protein
MRKLAAALLAVVPLLTLAGQAHGKSVLLRAVCGASGCKKLAGAGSEIIEWTGSTKYTSPSPYYVVRTRGGKAYWLPQSGWFALDYDLHGCWYNDCWLRVSPETEALLRSESAGLAPYRPHLAKATIDGKRVADPAPLLTLLGRLQWVSLPWAKLHPTRIVVWPAQPNPWITGRMRLGYDARHEILIRSDGYGHFRLPRALWSTTIREASTAQGSSTPFYAGVGIAVLAAVAALAAARRTRA